MTIQKFAAGEKEMKKIIRSAIKDAIKEEFFRLRLELTPEVSDKEMADIEGKYKEPDKDIVRSEWIEV